ncbi:MAG: glycosyltransferase family 4 protein [Chromatiaceae bacterium]
MTYRTLDASFPDPTPAAREQARQVLVAIPDDGLVLVDGLAYGVLPELAEAEGQRLRLVALVHHPLALETGLSPEWAAILRDAEIRALVQARLILVTSRFTAALLGGWGVPPSRLQVVEPGTDPAPAPTAQGSGSGTLRLLCVASLTPRKGHDLLLRALAGLRAEPWHLDCVGSLDRNPAWAEGLIRLRDELGLAGRVSFPGTLGEEELEGRYGGADLFVLPSRFEGYGMVFAEALAHGLPILATRAGASGETVPPEAGLLVPADDPVALRQALRRLMADTALRGRLAKGARTAGICLPTWRDAVAAFAAALEEAVEKAGRAGRDEVPEQVGREAMGDTQGPAPRVVGDVMMNIIPAHDGMIQTMAEIAGPEVALDG